MKNDAFNAGEIDDEYVPQYVLPRKLGFACSMEPEIRARCYRKQHCDDCSQVKEGSLRKEEIGVSTPDSVLDWGAHADIKQRDKDSAVKGGGIELYYPEDRLPAQIIGLEKDMVGGLGEGDFKLGFRADPFCVEESASMVLDRLSMYEQKLRLKSLFRKAWKSESHDECIPSPRYQDKNRLRFPGDEREMQLTYADGSLKSVTRRADEELTELASEVKYPFTSKQIKELDDMTHSISQAVCSSKANIVQPAMTASRQGIALKSEVGHSDCGSQLSRKPIQSTQASMLGGIQNLFSSSSRVLHATEPLEGSFFAGDVDINLISHYRPWQHSEKPSQLQLHIPTKWQFNHSDSVSSFDQGKGNCNTGSTLVTSEPVKCWSKVPMAYTGMPVSMSDHAYQPENSIVASLFSDLVEISEISVYEDSIRFKKYSNNSDGRDATLKRNQNDMGSNKRQKTEPCYVPSTWDNPATEIDKGMADNQSFKMQFPNVEQRRQRREFSDIEPVYEEMLKAKEEKDRESPHRHLFHLPHMRMWTKLRPGIWQFLERASKLYELHVYTMGSKVYATEMTKVLDPTGKLFAGRVISKGDEADVSGFGISSKSKDLDGVMGMESSAIVIDDTEKMWPHHRPNLIVIERYTYFPCSRRHFGLAGPSLLEIDRDERPEDGMLASTLHVIGQIHHDFFSKTLLFEVDVRDLLATKQRSVLMGCRIVFSRVFPMEETQPHLNTLWRLAEKFGAKCTTQIDEHVTHVVAISLGTNKVNWGLATGRHVVCTGWLEASALLYRRENERDFPVTTWQHKK